MRFKIILLSFIFFSIIIFTRNTVNSNYFISKSNFSLHQLERDLIIDNSFSTGDRILIEYAAQEWQKKTLGFVKFNIFLSDASNLKIDDKSIYIVKVSETHPEIFSYDRRNETEALGYYSEGGTINSILIVFNRVDGLLLPVVVMHELGHALGLKHEKQNKSAIMFPVISSEQNNLTVFDINLFCLKYKCH